MIANREGFGDILAEGNIRAAQTMGVGLDIIPHCRRLEHISVDPCLILGFSLGYAISTHGSGYLKNYSCLEFSGLAVNLKNNEVFSKDTIKDFYYNSLGNYNKIKLNQKYVLGQKNKCVADLVGCCCNPIGS